MNFSLTLFKFSLYMKKPYFQLFKTSYVNEYRQFCTNTFYEVEWTTLDFKWIPYYNSDKYSWVFSFLGLNLTKAIG